jgi:hypothetical protein
MAKGFGKPSSSSPSGYILVVVPQDGIYASNDPFGEDEKYVGITNTLEMARVWRKQKAVQKDLDPYLEWVVEEYGQGLRDRIEMEIKALYKGENGKLKTQLVQKLVIEKTKL